MTSEQTPGHRAAQCAAKRPRGAAEGAAKRPRSVAKGTAIAVSALAVVVFGLGVTLYLTRAPLQSYLSSVTGEEDLGEQAKGYGRLILLRLTGPSLQLAPETPMPHAGLNPFGVNTFLEQEVEPQKLELALNMIHAAGFRWIRQEFPWEDIEHSGRGDFWDHKYDQIVHLASQYGVQVIARLDHPPTWTRADGDARGTRCPPDDLQDFGNFVYAVVSRYKGRVRYYQIWNEPNIYPEWGEQPVDAAGYVRLLQVAYRRAKEADPNCVVLCAGLAQTLEPGPKNLNDLAYLQQMYDAGVQGYFDIMGVMAYGLWTGPGDHRASPELTNFARPQLIRDIMVRNGDADKPLWATEVGWNALPGDFLGSPIYGRVTLEQQARYAVQAYQRAQQEWPWMGVMNYWFFKRATDTETDQAFYYFRMLEPDFTPLPVYDAMKEYANRRPVVYPGYHQEDHWAPQWEGEWQDIRDPQAALGRLRRSTNPGDAASFLFVGTAVELVVHQGPNAGLLHYCVDCEASPEGSGGDGGRQGTIVLQTEAPQYGIRIALAKGLRNGTHRVEITAAGEPGMWVDIDGLVVRSNGGLHSLLSP
jgi:hypothetical protein